VHFHELEYNHRLVHEGLRDSNPIHYTCLRLEAREKVQLPPEYIVIHPGMAGSALNWPRSHYRTLIEKMSRHFPVVVTGTATDQNIIEPLKKDLYGASNIYWMDGRLNAPQLLGALSGAKALFAPSTGVIHLGASLGVPTFGIYSPVRVESAKRWGPKGPRAYTMTPPVDGPDCMALVTPEEIYNNIMEKLNSPKGSI
jgi:heptosyltransferase I